MTTSVTRIGTAAPIGSPLRAAVDLEAALRELADAVARGEVTGAVIATTGPAHGVSTYVETVSCSGLDALALLGAVDLARRQLAKHIDDR